MLSMARPANSHRDTVSICGHLAEAARWAAATAETASASVDCVASGITGSSASATRATVKWRRTSCARPANARNQPRTVPSAKPRRAATWRCPIPNAAISRQAPITTAASTRRGQRACASRMCVTWQPEQRVRRGRRNSRDPRSPRTVRGARVPTGASGPSRRDTPTGRPSAVVPPRPDPCPRSARGRPSAQRRDM